MPTFRITFTDGNSELVEGDRVTVEAGEQLVMRRIVEVMGRPRDIVVRRLHGADVSNVSEA